MTSENDRPTTGDAKRLVLFDLDGVLLDSRDNMERSWKQVRERLGVTVEFDKYFAEIGRPFGVIMQRLGLGDRAEEIEEVFRMASMENLSVARFYPGAVATLTDLRAAKVKMGIVTSKDKYRTNAILAMLPVSFASVRTPDPAVRGKPAPDHLLAAMVEVGVDPAETLYIGDMEADHEAALRAGVDYVHAAWGYGSAPEDGSSIVSEFGELAAIVLGGDTGEERGS
jgi:phosphoglycolate phosphatase